MRGQWKSSYFLEDKSKPLNPKNTSLNDSLHTQHLDLEVGDDSVFANATRTISKCVGSICTPRHVLGLLRVLKAITLTFIVFTILADMTYIIFVEFLSSADVKTMAGGSRDIILRVYGIAFSLIGLAIELDYSKVVKKISGLKGFLSRGFLYFFIAQLTGSHPLMLNGGNANNSQGYYYGDDANAANGDDYAAATDNSSTVTLNIPTSAVGFQRVTSFVLYVDFWPNRLTFNLVLNHLLTLSSTWYFISQKLLRFSILRLRLAMFRPIYCESVPFN